MIIFKEIKPNDTIKVLTNLEDEDIDVELYAVVKDNRGDFLEINYFNETSLLYKNARVYELEEEENCVQEANLLEHYANELLVEIKDGHWVIPEEIDEENSSSIYDESEDGGSDLNDFIVSDSEVDGQINKPPGWQQIDQDWKDWEPSGPGMKRFKDMVDTLEQRAKYEADELNLSRMR